MAKLIPTAKTELLIANYEHLAKLILDWFRPEARPMPWRDPSPDTPLPTPYSTWISETMLQQTQVSTVAAYWTRWIAKWPDIQSLANATEEEIMLMWEGLGYYNRARNVLKAAKVIMQKHSGIFPSQYEVLTTLPGIGPYTAGAIASIAFNQPMPIVDTNVLRVLSRTFAITIHKTTPAANGKDRIRQISQELVLQASKLHRPKACSWFNQAMMDLGATICIPDTPKCEACPLQENCLAHAEGKQELYPAPKVKQQHIEREDVALFIRNPKGKILIQQRAEADRNKNFWQLPMLEGTTFEQATQLFAQINLAPSASQPLLKLKHNITCYNITIRLYYGTDRNKTTPPSGMRYISISELDKIPFSSSHRKLLKRILNH